ncbi:MAG: PmoA family protein [Paludibaculum sp.]
MTKTALLALLCAMPLLQAGSLEWKDRKDGRVELLEDGKTALVYNYGPQLKEGAPENRRRCCYIFPVLTPGGVSMLDDFPKDHYHHRGVFWAWPVVETGSQKLDSWMFPNLQNRFENGWRLLPRRRPPR